MTVETQNASLHRAKGAKEDEFYTQREDVELEMKHYRKHFKGKVVYCNCDDLRVSAFFHYFSYNFEKLGLKKLIATCYKSYERDLFSTHGSARAKPADKWHILPMSHLHSETGYALENQLVFELTGTRRKHPYFLPASRQLHVPASFTWPQTQPSGDVACPRLKLTFLFLANFTPLNPPILETTRQAVQVIHDPNQGAI